MLINNSARLHDLIAYYHLLRKNFNHKPIDAPCLQRAIEREGQAG